LFKNLILISIWHIIPYCYFYFFLGNTIQLNKVKSKLHFSFLKDAWITLWCLNYTSLPSYVKIYTPLVLKYSLSSPIIQNILENFSLNCVKHPSCVKTFHSHTPLREAWITFSFPLMLKSTLYSLNFFYF